MRCAGRVECTELWRVIYRPTAWLESKWEGGPGEAQLPRLVRGCDPRTDQAHEDRRVSQRAMFAETEEQSVSASGTP